MSTLLHIESSPRKDRSYSLDMARVFLDAYKKVHPQDTLETLDLWSYALPEFNGETINAKYAVLHGKSHSPAQAAAWERVKQVFDRLARPDKLVFSLPMWNFGIPYKLKHFIDVITQPGIAFNVTPEGKYVGLVTGKRAVAIYARGGAYSAGTGGESLDFQKPYMDLLLGFIGITDVQSIIIEPTLAGPDKAKAATDAASNEARRIAQTF